MCASPRLTPPVLVMGQGAFPFMVPFPYFHTSVGSSNQLQLPQSGELHQLHSMLRHPMYLSHTLLDHTSTLLDHTSTPLSCSLGSCISCRARCTASPGWDPRGGGGSESVSSRLTRCWPAWGHCSSCWSGAGCRLPRGSSRECEKCEPHYQSVNMHARLLEQGGQER